MICRGFLLLSTGGKLALVPPFVEEKMEKMWNFGFYFFTEKLKEISEIGLCHSLGHAALHLWISIRETSNVDRLRVIGTCLKFPFFCKGVPYELGRKSQTSDWADFWHIRVFGGAEHESEVHLSISMKVEPFWGRFGWEKAKFPLFGPCIFSTCSNGITVLRGPLLKTCFLQLCFSYNFRYLWGKCR